MCLLPPPPSLILLTLVTDIPNSCCPTYCFASAIPACLRACLRRMSLEVMTILCRCENIETSEGVPLDVTGVAQVIHFKRPKNKTKAVAGDGDQRKTQENGSTNKLTSVCVCFSHLHGFFLRQ